MSKSYYQENQKRILEYRKKRRKYDNEFRERTNRQNKKSQKKMRKKTSKKKSRPVLTVIHNGNEEAAFLLPEIAKMGIAGASLLYNWKWNKILPESLHQRGRFHYYATSQVECIKMLVEAIKDTKLGLTYPEVSKILRSTWALTWSLATQRLILQFFEEIRHEHRKDNVRKRKIRRIGGRYNRTG